MKLRTIDVTKVQDIKIDTYMKPVISDGEFMEFEFNHSH